ncbi:hypothetical protein LJY25_20525 [Hymenobacter sp. BT175]|uniref:hypothetical protein n=1 Tax=Hymenobacter translucens TaxID=2886507 RepID=UPI001D0EB1E0|nr:hypothetical protein [Hymenobacter translucens]MCC2548846.1 hypothetical protein [Hymenobacter translucens]
MDLFPLFSLWLLLVTPLPWIYTMLHIHRGHFPGRWEKRRWFNTVLAVPVVGIFLYWSRGAKRRRSRRSQD